MDAPETPSASGPSRRSRRLQGTPATTAAGSPYARRPPLPRDPSSQTLAAIEGGSSSYEGEPFTFASARKDVVKANRRKSTGPEGLLGRVRKSLGWLVGRGSQETAEVDDNEDDDMQDSSRKAADEESAVDGRNTAASRAMNGHTARPAPARLPSGIPPPPPKRNFTQHTASIASRSQLGSMMDNDDNNEDPYAPKRLRTSHSTLNLPTAQSVPSRLATHASDGPSYPPRSRSPLRNPSPSRLGPGSINGASSITGSASRTNIFQSGPLGLPPSSSMSIYNRPASPSRRSVSPGGMSQTALVQPNSATSSMFGLTSQSPFRPSGGHSARSPDFSVLNISSGLARSPSLPRERLSVQQGSRLYPYQRSPSSLNTAFPRPAGTLPVSYSLNTGLSGTKRGYNNVSVSPPRISPIHANGSLVRQQSSTSYAGSNISPTSTDFGGHPHRAAKRQRMSVVWDPERGFVASDADGRPVHEEQKQEEVPKNEAERILERLENLRRPQLQGLRSRSPQRINVPLPAAADTPTNGNIFATRITGSQSMSALSSHAVSPVARRQRAAEEQSARERDRVRASGGLGERMRRDKVEKDRRLQSNQRHEGEEDMEELDNGRRSERNSPPRQRDQEASEQEDEVDELPQPSRGRRTRQRTRELSVMSDASDMHEDEQAFSPRRSTRNKGKGRAREESMEPEREREQPKRQPKSATSPPPANNQWTFGKEGKNKKSKQPEVHDDGHSEDDQDEVAPTKAYKQAKSTKPVSPPSKAPAASRNNKKRPASPEVAKEAPASIDQVMEDDAKDTLPTRARRSPTREVAPILSKRLGNGFSAKDVEDDEMVEEQQETDRTTIRHRTTSEVAKLKLPASVFANRFSFGKSPSSPILAAQRNQLPEVAPEAAGTAGPGSLPTPPAFSLPPVSAAPAASLNFGTPAKQPEALPSLSFGAPAPASKPASTAPPAAPSFSFGKPAPTTTEPVAPASAAPPSGGLFSFKPPAPASTPVEAAPAIASTKPLFQFSAPSASMSTPAAEPPKVPSFSFGAKPAESLSVEKTQPAANLFNSGTGSATEKASTPASTFSFGKAIGSTSASPAAAPTSVADKAADNPFAAFPSAGKRTAEVPETPAKTPSFAFGATTTTAAHALSFGKAAENGQTPAAQKPNFGAFNFPAASPAAGAAKDANAMSDSPPPASVAQPAATNAPFSPVIQASKGPSFTFGQPASSTPSAAAPVTGFKFGASANTDTGKAAPSNNPFGSLSSGSGGFSFGAKPDAQTAPPSRAGSQPPLSFASNGNSLNNGSSSASFTFGQPVQSPAATTTAVANPFGSAAAPAPVNAFGATTNTAGTPGSNNASFTFGPAAPSSAAPFTFGQPATVHNGTSTPSTPAFGGGNSAGFNFGAMSSTNTAAAPAAAAPLNFGGNTITAGQPAMGFGGGMPSGATTPGGTSLFNVGSGAGPTSPDKARQIKGRPKRRT